MKNDHKNDASPEENFQTLKSRSLSGIGSLVKRQVITKLVYLVSTIILARLLTPQVFGIYAIIAFIVQFFSTFGDVGLGAALIQKKGELTREELSTTFWLQQALVWTVALIVLLAAPLARLIYPDLPENAVWMLRVMVVSFVIASLKTIPAILLEREIRFDRIAQVDVVESISFYGLAVLFSWQGLDVWSFVYAAIARSILSVVTVYAVSPWRPALIFRYCGVAELVRFGVPYQGNNLLAFVKDAVTPLFVGTYAGPAAVGYINWARNFAFAPLMLSEVFGKVAFPSFSRIQEDRLLLARTIERSVRMMTLVLFPVTSLMIALGPQLIHVLFTDKWLPALRAYYFYCTSPLVIGFMLPMHSAVLSLGKSLVILRMMVLLLFLEWGLGVLFVLADDFNGIAYSQPFIAAIFCFIYHRVLDKNGVPLNVMVNIRAQLAAAFCAGGVAWLLSQQFRSPLAAAIVCSVAGLAVYAACIPLFSRGLWGEFIEYLSKIINKGYASP